MTSDEIAEKPASSTPDRAGAGEGSAIVFSVAEIADVVGGRLAGLDRATAEQLRVTGPVVADSRLAEPGSLFVADAGGHDFAGDAVARGAVAALGSREIPGVPTVVAPVPTGAVPERDHSVIALGRLAHHLLALLSDTTVVAVTGSSGKTGTKDLLGQVLASAGPTIAPQASLNDELGVPLTVLRADRGTRFLVLEMGARGRGHLAYLTSIARPAVSVVLNVGSAHAGEFGGKEGIAEAKGELVEALSDDGIAVLNADDPLVRGMSSRTTARVVLAGESPDADVRAEDVRLDESGRPVFRLTAHGRSADVHLRLVGRHHVANALSVAATALTAGGMPIDDVAAALSTATRRARWRMEVTERPDGVTIVNDAYNANPDSMRAALHAVRALARGRRTWAVLGEMLELGPDSAAEHHAIGRLATELGFDRVVAVGPGAAPIGEGAGAGASYVRDADAAATLLRSELRRHDVVLVKSSRDAGLRYLGDALVSDREENTG